MYNENEPFAISWLEQLQERNLIRKGRIDGRSITELEPKDCEPTSHFFAGIGGWAYALQLAGWNPARPVWTGSAPCQPFSVAGAGSGFSDSRHLWPIWYELIKECKPSVIFGEQTASKLGREWLAGVRSDLETLGYAVGAADLCAASVNAPHRRQRLYWVAYTGHGGDRGRDGFRDSTSGIIGTERENQGGGESREGTGRLRPLDVPTDGGAIGVPDGALGYSKGGSAQGSGAEWQLRQGSTEGESKGPSTPGLHGLLDNPLCVGTIDKETEAKQGRDRPNNGVSGPASASGKRLMADARGGRGPENELRAGWDEPGIRGEVNLRDCWDNFDLAYCREIDGNTRVRRIESGTLPVATRIPNRVGRIRGFGNAIVPQLAATFIRSFLEAEGESFA